MSLSQSVLFKDFFIAVFKMRNAQRKCHRYPTMHNEIILAEKEQAVDILIETIIVTLPPEELEANGIRYWVDWP